MEKILLEILEELRALREETRKTSEAENALIPMPNGGKAIVAEIRGFREDMNRMGSTVAPITKATAELLKKWEDSGLPLPRID